MIRQKSKSPLALMEQAIMILVFALAAALCVQAFVWADTMSKDSHNRDQAANQSQIVAEATKAFKGDLKRTAVALDGGMSLVAWSEAELQIYYDKDWNRLEIDRAAEAVYVLRLQQLQRDEWLCRSQISVTAIQDGVCIFDLPVSWQEVAAHE